MSIQIPLFDKKACTVWDDVCGRIEYLPDRLEPNVAAVWFETLRESVRWETARRQMYDREVDVPRLVARFSLGDACVPDPVREGARLAGRLAGCAFDSAGVNLYRDQNDSVAWHSDKLRHLEPGTTIAILSLGAVRRMSIRSKMLPRKTAQVDLESGSILLMDYATQLHLDHAIPKLRHATAARISIAFRKRPQGLPERASSTTG